MSRRRLILGLAVVAIAVPVIAQNMPAPPPAMQMPTSPPGKPDPKLVEAGSYAVESAHTQISFGVDHLGFNPFYGTFSGVTGSLTLDPAKPAAAKLTVSVPVSSIQTTSAKLTEELVAPDWFDAAKFPTATFKSTKVTPTGPTTATIQGDLTLHGVTKSITLDAHFHGAGPNFMTKTTSVGFEARGEIKRSDFGVAKGVPLVSDGVGLLITAAFDKAAS